MKEMIKKCECGTSIPERMDKCFECTVEEFESIPGNIGKLDKAKYSDLLNQIGRARGLSWCRRCQGTWNWKKGKTINLSNEEGMFPLCEDCFDELNFEEVLGYYKEFLFNVVRTERIKYWTDKRINEAFMFMWENIIKEKEKIEVKK